MSKIKPQKWPKPKATDKEAQQQNLPTKLKQTAKK